MTLNPKLADWLNSRAIDPETAVRLGVYSAKRGPDGEPTPAADGDILVYPYIENGREVGAKYRARGKKFWQRKGGRKTFFNSDVLDDPALIDGSYPLVICEGENDALALIQAGYPFAVSVPDGAPPARDDGGNLIDVPDSTDDVDPKTDEKYRYIANNLAKLDKIKRIVLATDGDEPGWRLSQELARRLDKVRCFFVTYPEGCKDPNEVLIKHGPRTVMELVTLAKPFPVKGLYKLSDFPDEPEIACYDTGFPELTRRPEEPTKPHMALYRGAFVVVSGLPGSGKSLVCTQLAANMAGIHGWRVCIASFEMKVAPVIRDMLRSAFLRQPRQYRSREDIARADAWIEDYFSFICLRPGDEDTECDIDWVLARASDAVIRHGANMLLLDPWNEVEHKRRYGESAYDYTNRAVRSLKRFCSTMDCATVVVAHPTKAGGLATKGGEPMTLYDISDGATWYNKAELGIIVSRGSAHDTMSTVSIKKVKFKSTGRVGDALLQYDEQMEAFIT